jgi:folate-binding protein YgfZ
MIAHLDDRRVLRLSGVGVRDFLQGLLTSDVRTLTPETPVWAALLTAQGKYIADMVLFDGGADAVLLDVAQDRIGELHKKLRLYRLRRPIEIDESPLQVFASWDEPAHPHPDDPRLAALGKRWLAEDAETTADAAAWHAHRLTLGVPDSADFEPDRLMWLESNAAELNGVSFQKGCFVGQENTARMNYRGKVRKRLLTVALTAAPGEDRAIMAGDREAGTLMSHAGMRGMALMRLEYADAALTLNGAAVSVEWPEWLPRPSATDGEAMNG